MMREHRTTSVLRTAVVLGLVVLSSHAAAGGITATTVPSPVVLGKINKVLIEVKGLPGAGPVKTAVNVGAVEHTEIVDGTIRLKYRPPPRRHPQRLCLLLWRKGTPGALVVRIPLHGTTRVPIKTRVYSQVTLTIGGRVFGPASTGKYGRVSLPVVVPPGVTHGRVEVIDQKGMRTHKKAAIRQPVYNPLAWAVVSRPAGPRRRRHHFTIAAAEKMNRPVAMSVQPPDGPPRPLSVKTLSDGRWSAVWDPGPEAAPGEWVARAAVSGLPSASRQVALTVEPPPPPKVIEPPAVVDRKPVAPRPPPAGIDRLQLNVGVAAGLMHNGGALISPRLGLSAGVDYRLGPGRIGGGLFAAVGWSSQDVPVVTDAAIMEPAASSVLLLPLGVSVSYALDLSFVSPYIVGGFVAQVVSSRNESEDTGTLEETSVVFGALGLLGARRRLGPGSVFFQAGYQWSRLDSDAAVLLAGGLVVEAGYRLELNLGGGPG